MRFKNALPVIIYTLVLIAAAIMPSGATFNNKKINLIFELRLDYLIHCCAYMGFYLLIILANFFKKEAYPTKYFPGLFIATLALAGGTEIIQLFLSYRVFNLFDFLANVSGIVLGVLILYFTTKYRIPSRLQRSSVSKS